MAVVKRFLAELTEPVFPFHLFSEIVALNLKAGVSSKDKVEALVNQLPRSHHLLLGVLVDCVRDLSAREPNAEEACDRWCVTLAHLLVRPKVAEDKEKAVVSIRAAARF